ncbi:hypothetical protein [Streptomyces sp. NPDC015131]|uniref:DUF7341 domain-containing protein n=1 Tax=Streptomyces sp. NPDC015131 TaxID=3364941 RepID=UPI0036FD4F79
MSIREIEQNVALLVNGWEERIEYRVKVSGQLEERANTVRMAGLLEQLRKHTGTTQNGRAERGSPNKPGSRPPGSTTGFMLLDEITAEAGYWTDRVLIERGLDRTWALRPMPDLLLFMRDETRRLEETHPGLVADIAAATRAWVRDARRLLSLDARTVMIAGTVCGECGGGLAVADDASTAVRCIGHPGTAACGVRYERHEWLGLLEAQGGRS